jgi:MTH538 TIR-like domain (DUF1863)
VNSESFKVVLIGPHYRGRSEKFSLHTSCSRWVKYEIAKSIERGNGLLGIDISKIKDFQGNTSERCGEIPKGYDFYLWNNDDGYNNMGNWIEKAAKAAGK